MRRITTHSECSHADVLAVAKTWPAERPMAVLHSGGSSGPWARWSMIAPPRGHLQINVDGSCWNGPNWPGLEEAIERIDGCDPLAIIDAAVAADRNEPVETDSRLPFIGGWLVSLRYELGGIIEPATQPLGDSETGLLADLLWCPDALVHDGHANQWWQIGDVTDVTYPIREGAPLHLETWNSRPDRAGFEAAVEETIELIRRGDLFQANIARQLSTTCQGDLRGFALDALATSGAWFGCWLELPGDSTDRAVLGLSPELFLDLDGESGHLRTRPIKGTRSSGERAVELARSDKDAAELNMIVDLMRNDLGRVCTIGSIEVSQPRMIESHPTVHHGVAEVTGRLQPGRSVGDLLRATFPPGSVTGAPKIRAMQVINELEGTPRGAYCGAVGCLSTSGDLRLGVSIRTAAFEGEARGGFRDVIGAVTYGTGCGIVADSDPAEEYRESEHKAEALMRISPGPVLS